ncbi:hypothetical protein ABLB90_06215 [Photorhabdus bodei]|uniref:Uncharacterized protein n=2 Tax=Photorhabdus TaxID=29487 RepID=A0ABX0B233_9GAMM|nr:MULTISPECIES: hypothetical protein [Photorhabdus]MDB6369571.1 hypothetical protein [Photorhabdus bodei]MDB6373822.1 hypothetical protein [Photorhabdus bodei]NDL13347.1 hypothetical protein [Photorhabdus kayaii]NDL26709.1 hypothetical protein [Photorhabdus kayaii]
MTGVSECSQQRGNLKDDGYINISINQRINLYTVQLTSLSRFVLYYNKR